MNPTVKSWETNPIDVGPLYPLAGWEPLLCVAGLLFCGGFAVWKFKTETANYQRKARELRDGDELHRALDNSSENSN